ncbi:hypothetical protein GMST_06440 [Geomonas silvestris]|uniref:Nitrogen fixation protein FixH n=1 Tax=Geomonas silvestris TaxID=2740184 RepID=A0A6V8MF86_9BACT|nr:FixH family protein [Geomonas silvestris]GFO58319.1 hypothetical protein GMST_06440 [Geomonas silvestris]
MSTPQKTATRWQLALAFLVGLFVVASIASFSIAARRVSPVVDPDYYNHGLNYGAAQAANPGRDWTITPHLEAGALVVAVKDRTGAPVVGGKLLLTAPNLPVLPLAEGDPGLYRAPRPAAAGGQLRGTLSITRGSASASRPVVLID